MALCIIVYWLIALCILFMQVCQARGEQRCPQGPVACPGARVVCCIARPGRHPVPEPAPAPRGGPARGMVTAARSRQRARRKGGEGTKKTKEDVRGTENHQWVRGM
jgi:hypothetical protein